MKGSTGWAWIKTLAKDTETGARTALIKFDPGFTQERTTSIWPMDSYMLEGEMQCGDQILSRDSYYYRPSGVTYGPIKSRNGCTRLVFTSDDRRISSETPMFVQDVSALPWVSSYTDMPGQERKLKVLRQDKKASYSLFLHTYRVPGSGPRAHMTHVHTHSEEVFVLEGELEQYCGEIDGHIFWKPWTYTCRAPNQGQHGGPTTKVPCTVLIRLGWVGEMKDRYKAGQTHSPETKMVEGAFFIE